MAQAKKAPAKKTTSNGVEKSNAIFGMAITLLVLLCIQVIAGWTWGPVGFFTLASGVAGIITTSIFIAKYKKYGYDMPDAKAYGIVFIVFGVLSWGYWVFGIATGIVVLCCNKKSK